MNKHTADHEAQDPTAIDPTRWVTRTEDGNWWYHADDTDPEAVHAELPTDADRRRKALDSAIIKQDGLWFDINCYDCGMRQSRPIHGHCFE